MFSSLLPPLALLLPVVAPPNAPIRRRMVDIAHLALDDKGISCVICLANARKRSLSVIYREFVKFLIKIEALIYLRWAVGTFVSEYKRLLLLKALIKK